MFSALVSRPARFVKLPAPESVCSSRHAGVNQSIGSIIGGIDIEGIDICGSIPAWTEADDDITAKEPAATKNSTKITTAASSLYFFIIFPLRINKPCLIKILYIVVII